ncbi:MAG: zf-HC2 domain-containing protein [Methylacidiphilales bacterium]|nr:zf-HC2 domain-containing protein [Candidatus Methylacidiphilales bacterium]
MPEENPSSQPPHDDPFIKGENWFSAKIVNFICAITPKCRQASRLLSEGLDHPIPLLTRLRLRAHFLICIYCERYGKHLQVLHRAAHDFPDHCLEISSEEMPEGVKTRIKQALHETARD